MLSMTVWLFVGVVGSGVVTSALTCPDGRHCPDSNTCCKTRDDGYKCCIYPHAMCCADLVHCCPSGYRCNLVTRECVKQDQPWMKIPMLSKAPVLPVSPLQEADHNLVPDRVQEADHNLVPDRVQEADHSLVPDRVQEADHSLVPDRVQETDSSVIWCDHTTYCPDGTTCCRHPKGVWFCCPYAFGRCCADGFHCCPHGFDCDLTYTHCVRGGLPSPFSQRHALPSVPASHISPLEDKGRMQETPLTGLTESSEWQPMSIRCDVKSFCPAGKTCCKNPKGRWVCCPHPLGQCCSDGQHCCEYGYTCDPSSMTCRSLYSQIPSGAQEPAQLN